VTRAALEESDERVREEAADVLYHLGVLLQARGLEFSDALEELTQRMATSTKPPSG
jgi:phosphoribosyl-ATP pyrophosphohydrolase/phosphoribosyl-AMP cyclohydrolase